MKVILFSQGSGGDVLPFLQLGRRLRERRHTVTLLTHCAYEENAKLMGLNFMSLDNSREYESFLKEQPLLNAPRGIAEFLRRHTLPKVPLHCRIIGEQISQRDTVLLTRDLFDTAPRLITEKLGVPVMWVFMNPSQLLTWKLRSELFSRVLAPVVSRLRALVDLPPAEEKDLSLWYPKRSIALWPDWFVPAESDWPTNVVPVGFITEDATAIGELPSEIEAALRKGQPPILITAGTGAYLGAEFYSAGAQACRLLNRRGILVTQNQRQLPDDLGDCVQAVGYLPFQKVVPRMGAVIHHGGMGTLSCAMSAGVPQLILPMGADRPDNALRVQRLGVAEFLPPPKWKPETIAEALRRLLESPSVSARCRELAERLRRTDAAAAACEVIEQASAA